MQALESAVILSVCAAIVHAIMPAFELANYPTFATTNCSAVIISFRTAFGSANYSALWTAH